MNVLDPIVRYIVSVPNSVVLWDCETLTEACAKRVEANEKGTGGYEVFAEHESGKLTQQYCGHWAGETL